MNYLTLAARGNNMPYIYGAAAVSAFVLLLYILGWGRRKTGTRVPMGAMGERLKAELARADCGSRNNELAKIAEESAAGSLTAFAATAINAITNTELRDKTAAAGARTLSGNGDIHQAKAIAKLIADKRLRNETLAKVAESAK